MQKVCSKDDTATVGCSEETIREAEMITTAQITNCGGRSQNEDTVWIGNSDRGVCAIVADGLGGHGGGQIASRAAVESLSRQYRQKMLSSREGMRRAFESAHREVTCRQSKSCMMKTTAVVLCIDGQEARWGHVGDSRLYHFSGNHIVEQTLDQSVSQIAALMGEIAPEQIRFHEDRNKVLRALGGSSWEPALADAVSVASGTHAFLLCSDGFWEYVYEAEMERELAGSASPEEWLARMERILRMRVKGDNDNYTAAAVFCSGEHGKTQGRG